MRSEILTAVKMPMLVLWIVTMLTLIGRYQHFVGRYLFHLLCLRTSGFRMKAVFFRSFEIYIRVNAAIQPRRPTSAHESGYMVSGLTMEPGIARKRSRIFSHSNATFDMRVLTSRTHEMSVLPGHSGWSL